MKLVKEFYNWLGKCRGKVNEFQKALALCSIHALAFTGMNWIDLDELFQSLTKNQTNFN